MNWYNWMSKPTVLKMPYRTRHSVFYASRVVSHRMFVCTRKVSGASQIFSDFEDVLVCMPVYNWISLRNPFCGYTLTKPTTHNALQTAESLHENPRTTTFTKAAICNMLWTLDIVIGALLANTIWRSRMCTASLCL